VRTIETPEQRSERGRAMLVKAGGDLDGWTYHADCRAKLTSSERQTFDLEFVRARAVAGVRPSVDMALAAMRAKLSNRLGTPTWRAAR
jgi:hypothetical protein